MSEQKEESEDEEENLFQHVRQEVANNDEPMDEEQNVLQHHHQEAEQAIL